MRIKKLELVGFKSFKDRTVIHFDEGITGIVGPNGCGKSNIVDALVWVMGEMSAKHLRGSSMEDVIFAGAEGYAPLGMAEVSLTLENDGGPFPANYIRHSEVMITRRLHRSGESEYLINKEPARLKDIQEIFMDTGAGSKGFSIIEQGAIGKIITAKPEERRTLIEEAAGITKFKVRKRESQRKLVSTDQNLVRLQDIIGEQKRQLGSLERQAQRAERYRKIKTELEEKDLFVSAKNYLGIKLDTDAAEKTFTEAKEAEASVSSNVSESQVRLETLKLKRAELETAVNERQMAHKELLDRVTKKEHEIRELQFEIEQAKRNKEMAGNILDQHSMRREALEKDKAEIGAKLESISGVAERLRSEFEEKNQRFVEIQSKISHADEDLTVKRREMLTVSSSVSHMDASRVGLSSRVEEMQERLAVTRETQLELESRRIEIEKERNKVYKSLETERQLQLDIMQDVDNFTSNLELLKEQVEVKGEECARFKDELNEVVSRLYGLENLQSNFEGFEEGVKSVMLWQKQTLQARADGGMEAAPMYFPVAEVVEVPAEYEIAMEAALGNRLQMLLSQDHETSLSAVDYLKDHKSGRSSFIPADLISTPSLTKVDSLQSEDGFKAVLSEVVQIPEKFQKQISYFIKDIVIVDSLRTALRLRGQFTGYTYVTLDGDTLSVDGVITGGNADNVESGVLKRRREIKELTQKKDEWAGKFSLAEASLKKLQSQVKSLEEELENARKKNTEKEILVAELRKDFERAENELKNAQVAVDRQKEMISREESTLSVEQDKLADLEERLAESRLRLQELETAVEQLTEELKSSRQGIEGLQQEVTRLQVESAAKSQEEEGLSLQLSMIEKSLSEVGEQFAKMSVESSKSEEALQSHSGQIEQSRIDLERMIRDSKEAEFRLGKVKDEYEKESATCRELEETVSKSILGINDFRSKMNEAQLKLEQLKMKEQYLIDQVNEKYMKDLREIAPQFQEKEGDLKVIEAEVEELRGKIKKIGEVNLSAIEEYDDLSERYKFLSQQHEDLTMAKEQLRKVIDRINRICSRRFRETFDQVNSRFTQVFPVLFGGGEARLVLIEHDDKGEMGIDIVAKPPGKKLQNVGLLSGGEKALTAVSLIFSIFLVKPSPFCLLDEVDAPLDDANVFRFNDLVREMAKRSQLIIVTHNKHTMKVNDRIFGVTMENKGVSKLVSVSLDVAEKVAGT